MSHTPRSTVIIPLYIYPNPGAWDPLYKAIDANLTQKFIVIINPSSGPGTAPWWPNTDYVREIPRLNALPNVQTVGYVRTNYCNRELSEVCADIDTYATWSKDFEFSGLGVEGIFFDETPNTYSEKVKSYLDGMSQHVKLSEGILGSRLVIHNPGTAVDPRLTDPGPDITTVVEVGHTTFETPEYQEWLKTSSYDRARTCYMVHSVPSEKVAELTYSLREKAEYLFVVDLAVDYYHSFNPTWLEFVASMTRE